MMAAALAKGRTMLVNCAREPEVEELGRVLNKMGAEMDGAGTDIIHVRGRDGASSPPFDHAIIPDRIEAGTYMCAAAMAEGADVTSSGPSCGSRGVGAQAPPGRRGHLERGADIRVRRPGRSAP